MNKKYKFVSEITNKNNSSYVPDVAFHPNGSIFAVCYRDNSEIHIYDSKTLSLIKKYSGQESQLSFPHGLLYTNNHLIVTNKLNAYSIKPSVITVYNINDMSSTPVCTFNTPIEHLREAHSLDIYDEKLLITYCGKDIGAILTYNFNDQTGIISGPTSSLENWFSKYGEPKGISFNETGNKVFITLSADQLRNKVNFISLLKKRIKELLFIKTSHHFNGIAVFSINKAGELSKEPIKLISKPKCRLENINIINGICAVSDPLNNTVSIYNFNEEDDFNSPIQTIQKNLIFPHDACLSPNTEQLVITNYGIKIIDGQPQWNDFVEPNNNKFLVYQLS